MNDWKIYKKGADPHDEILNSKAMPSPPSWRDPSQKTSSSKDTYQPGTHEVDVVNAALMLRRPILITGNPGSGKSSLAYSVAKQLKLGEVLWLSLIHI